MSEENYTLVKILAGLPRTERGKPISIHGDPKGKTFLYCNGNSIFIRNIEDPSECDVYTQHAKNTSCAAYAPSGFYIASGDVGGKLRIWDTVNKTHLLKYEYQPLAGAIKDIAWTEDSKRLAVCGEGRESFATAILWDSGSTVGDISYHQKNCNNISIKQNRPYKLVVASDDQSTTFFDGVPFKLKTQFHDEHTNFVNCCRFSPDGSKYATAGADGKCFIHDGKEGTLIGQLNEPAGKIHNGGVYAIAWSKDSKYLMTASGDKTVKIWNFDDANYISNKEEVVFNMGNDISDMQVGCAWVGDTLISVSLSGNINYLDMENPSAPKKTIKGHTKAIVASCLTEDRATLFTSSFDGVICYWNLEKVEADYITGTGHKSQVTKMCCLGDNVITCGIDDTVRFISVLEKKYKETSIKLDSQPQDIDSGNLGLTVVACLGGVIVIQDTSVTHKYKTQFEAKSVAVNSDLGKVAIGTDDSKVVIYDIDGDQLKETTSFSTNGIVTSVKFSPDNNFIACCTDKKQVKIVLTADFKTERANWASHATKVNGIAWTPDSKHLASCGVDGTVYTWDVERAERGTVMRGAHSLAVDVTSCQWSSDETLLTTGRQDCSVRMWQINH